jgi:hypothetical protein
MDQNRMLLSVIGALFTVLMFFAGLYVSNTGSTINQLVEQQRQQSERVTTLEESQRNTRNALDEIKVDVKDIKNALIGPNQSNNR